MVENKIKIDFSKFTNCLRIAIVPHHFENERIFSIKKFCQKYNFNNVMFFINAEEYNVGHMLKREAEPWVATIKKAKKVFNDCGISTSLNPWMEIGHLDRGRKLKKEQNFTNLVDMNGKSCNMVVCPIDENWQNYFLDFYDYLIQEIEPEIIWIEDDFRLHNHGDLEFGGCFCDKHMQIYNQILKTNYTRAELVKKIFSVDEITAERKCWLDVSKDTMLSLSEKIANNLKTLKTKVHIGLMSSTSYSHCMEARNWTKLHENLNINQAKIDRIHLPCYIEESGKKYYYEFNRVSMVNRAFLSDDFVIYPELENSAFSTYAKDSRFLQFQLESAIPLIINGMTYDIYDFVGNGVLDSFGYGEVVLKTSKYMQAVQNLLLKFSSMQGVVVPIDESTCYNREIKNSWQDLYPTEFDFISYLSAIGITYKLSKDKIFKNQTIALIGNNVNNFSSSELVSLFADNYIILDGMAVIQLGKKNLFNLIHAQSAEYCLADTDFQSYEEVLGKVEINGINGYRASSQEKAGNYILIKYNQNVKIKSALYGHDEQYVGDGFAESSNFSIIPYDFSGVLYEQFNDLRKFLLLEVLKKQSTPMIITNSTGISPFLYKTEDGYVLMLINTTVNSFEQICFDVRNLSFKYVYIINKKTGKKESVKNIRIDSIVTIYKRFDYLSTETLLLI